MESIESLMEAIEDFPGAVIIVTHSEEILKRCPNRLVVFDRGEVSVFEGGYEDFLSRIGWEGEEDPSAAPPPKKAAASQDLKKEIQRCEKRITKLEQESDDLRKAMDKASAANSIHDLTNLSETYNELQHEIEKTFNEMAELDKQLQGR